MNTEGIFEPESADEARRAYEDLVAAARTVVKESARAMEFDRDEFESRVTEDVVATAHDALFASLLRVRVGSRDEFDEWLEDTEYDAVLLGNENVSNVAWHVAPFTEHVVATTFESDREAAVSTLRRQAYGRVYREELP